MRTLLSPLLLVAAFLPMMGGVPVIQKPGGEGQGSETAKPIPTPLPVVIWHGMGDTCCLPISMGSIKKRIEEAVPGVYVNSLMIGDNVAQDQYNGYLMPIAKQLDLACKIVADDGALQGGFHAVGFSQGGLFLRALVQTCPAAKVFNLVSIGGPQQGIFGIPKCTNANNTLCETMRALLELGAYNPLVQDRLVQAQYWHDPVASVRYASDNVFLPGVNGDAGGRNETHAARIAALRTLVLVKFTGDTVVVPRDSEWFGFYGPDGKGIVGLEDQPMYKEDWIGLRALDEGGRLVRLESPGDHLAMPPGYFQDKIIPYLSQPL